MKKLIFIAALSILLSACGGSTSSTSMDESSQTSVITETSSDTSITSIDTSTSLPEGERSIVVNYIYPDGILFDRVIDSVKIGNSYRYVSPSVNFMTPEREVVEGVMGAENISINVKYNYSKTGVTNLKKGDVFDSIFVDPDKGISFSFLIKNASVSYEALFVGETFIIFDGYLEARSDSSRTAYYGRYNANRAVFTNGGNKHSLFGDLMVATISINPDKSISIYKNGLRVITYPANLYCSEYKCNVTMNKPTIRNVSDNLMEEIAEDGFRLGLDSDGANISYTIDSLCINYAVDDETINELIDEQYTLHTIHYKDEDGNKIFADEKVFVTSGEYYRHNPKTFTGLKAKPNVFSGTANGKEEFTFIYSPGGEEHIKTPLVNNKASRGDWANTADWTTIAENLTGDFVVSASYLLEGGKNGANAGETCWQTYLSIITENTNKGNRFVSRLDWFGWQDGQGIGGNATFSNWTSATLPYDDLYDIFQKCETEVTYKRLNNVLTIETYFSPLRGKHVGEEIYYVVTLDGINKNSLSIYINGEFANTTVNSIIY